ncbi:MAG: peptidylprolyl isomerase [bacterium]
MKKLLIFSLVLLLLTGCTSQPVVNQEEEIANTDQEKQVEPTEFDEEIEINGQTMKSEELLKAYTRAIIKTNLGEIKIKFYGQESPTTVANFLKLANAGFYNGTKFHRVIKDFMIQGGDPNSRDDDWSNDGMGGPGYMFDDEFNAHKLVAGSLAMANSGPDTNGSQFFIVTAESTPWLDGKHTNFGEVIDGMDVIRAIEIANINENDHPLEDIVIESIELLK